MPDVGGERQIQLFSDDVEGSFSRLSDLEDLAYVPDVIKETSGEAIRHWYGYDDVSRIMLAKRSLKEKRTFRDEVNRTVNLSRSESHRLLKIQQVIGAFQTDVRRYESDIRLDILIRKDGVSRLTIGLFSSFLALAITSLSIGIFSMAAEQSDFGFVSVFIVAAAILMGILCSDRVVSELG